jgi:NAD(P)-dependent dehydrogenase (short-subunit alcohol dehydrogenase family)
VTVMHTFKDKVAFITGGAGTIGAALGKACLEQGIRVVLADLNEPELQQVAERLGYGPEQLRTVVLDVREPESWERAATSVETNFGPVRLLFNNAGVTSTQAVTRGGGVENLTIEEWRWTLAVNLDGVFLGLKTYLPRFKQTSERTYIVNTSAMAGVAALRANGGCPLSYCGSKAAVAHMTAQLRTDLDEQGVTHIGVSVLYPGQTRSNMFAVSYRLSPGADLAHFDESQGRRTFHKQGSDPDALGRYTLQAIERGDFHILTHADWREQVLAYGEEFRHSFRAASADAGFADPAARIVDLKWSRQWLDQDPAG